MKKYRSPVEFNWPSLEILYGDLPKEGSSGVHWNDAVEFTGVQPESVGVSKDLAFSQRPTSMQFKSM